MKKELWERLYYIWYYLRALTGTKGLNKACGNLDNVLVKKIGVEI